MNSAVANRLINSPFTSLFVKLLRAVRHPALKARTCSIIGYMVRHATVIDPEIVKSGLINTLVE